MKIGLIAHKHLMPSDLRYYDGIHAGYGEILSRMGHVPLIAPDVDVEGYMEGFLDYVDAIIFPGGDYLPEMTLSTELKLTMKKDKYDFKEGQRKVKWLEKAIEKDVPVLALGENFYHVNNYFGGKGKAKPGFQKKKINLSVLAKDNGIKDVFGEGFKVVQSKGKVKYLGEMEDLSSAERSVLLKDKILAINAYPEFDTYETDETIFAYFIEHFVK